MRRKSIEQVAKEIEQIKGVRPYVDGDDRFIGEVIEKFRGYFNLDDKYDIEHAYDKGIHPHWKVKEGEWKWIVWFDGEPKIIIDTELTDTFWAFQTFIVKNVRIER